MGVIREIREVTSNTVTVPVPDALLHHKVEIIVLPLDEHVETAAAGEAGDGWPDGFCERFAGSCPDFPDIESEGDYEIRELPE
ncbi:hypothetical protein FJY63_00130 [Candidatus Sumerlaeota bacterium]|nr:hypothetical protein [Candidatus Sumerlaeota bacterium]